jgi:hypothetical protein
MNQNKVTFSIRVEIEMSDCGILEMAAFIPYVPCSGEEVKYLKQIIAYPAQWEVDAFVKAKNL